PVVLGDLPGRSALRGRVAPHVASGGRCDRWLDDVYAVGGPPRWRPVPGQRAVLAAPRLSTGEVDPADRRTRPSGTVGVVVEARPRLSSERGCGEEADRGVLVRELLTPAGSAAS